MTKEWMGRLLLMEKKVFPMLFVKEKTEHEWPKSNERFDQPQVRFTLFISSKKFYPCALCMDTVLMHADSILCFYRKLNLYNH